MRDRPSSSSWQLALLALRVSRIRYPLIALIAIYFLHRGRLTVLSLVILTTPLCWLLKWFLLSGKEIEIENIEGRFFNEILAKSRSNVTGKL